MDISHVWCHKCYVFLACDLADDGKPKQDAWIKVSYQTDKDNSRTVYLCETCKGHYYNDMKAYHERWFVYNDSEYQFEDEFINEDEEQL